MRNPLLNLIKANSRRGSFRAEGNTIYIYDVIVGSELEAEWWGGIAPESFAKALAAIEGDAILRINSPGGDVFAARAMVQAMREHAGSITVHVDGYAASAASLLAAAGDRTVMAEGAFIMIHESWTLTVGNKADHGKTQTLLDQIDRSIAETYAARGRKSAEDFAAMMVEETWLGPAEAVEVGLADEVVTSGDTRAARAKWNVDAYRHAPAPPPQPAAPPPAAAAPDQNAAHRLRAHRLRLLHASA
ncbi:MAG: Clp protease ClpP [Proteobacteria bacterium]|nr:Clp protease ClpP [Pseudomonadota bacterium]